MLNFTTQESALKHLMLHVLTPSESHAWNTVWHSWFPVLADTDDAMNDCFQLRNQLNKWMHLNSIDLVPKPFDALLEKYLVSIDHEISEAKRLEWCVRERNHLVFIASCGLFCIITLNEGIPANIATAFLPGFGSREGTTRSNENHSDPHARVQTASRMRTVRDSKSRNSDYSAISLHPRMKERRSDTFTDDEKLYHLVFRPVIKFIRAWSPGRNNKWNHGLEVIKAVLPPMSRLTLEHWKALRDARTQECVHG